MESGRHASTTGMTGCARSGRAPTLRYDRIGPGSGKAAFRALVSMSAVANQDGMEEWRNGANRIDPGINHLSATTTHASNPACHYF